MSVDFDRDAAKNVWEAASKLSKESASKLNTVLDDFSGEVEDAKLRLRNEGSGLANSAFGVAEAALYPNCDAAAFRKCLQLLPLSELA